jgi:hypothetical protein
VLQLRSMSLTKWCLLAVLASAAGCSRQPTAPCEPDARYSAARSAPPVQIPDDLTPPNETDALRLPDVDAAGATTAGECLEAPPSFFGEARPLRTSAEDEGESRRQRRQARRQARANEAEQESAAPASEQGDAEPAGNDRVIEN